MPIMEKTLNTRLDALGARFGQTAAELQIRARSEIGGIGALRNAIFAGEIGEAIFLPTADHLDDIVGVLESTPAFVGEKNAAIAVFEPETTNPVLQRLQEDIADAIVTGVIGLGAIGGGRALEAQIDLLLSTVLSIDDTSRGVRDLFSGRRGLDGHQIPRDLLDRLEQLQKSTCFAGVRHAMTGLAGAIASETPSFDKAQQIDSIVPNDACPEEMVRIEGTGFGARQNNKQVMFTGAHHTAYVIAKVIRGGWSDTTIDVIVPIGAGQGPVAVAEPAASNAGTVAAAAGELAGEMATCLGEGAGRAVKLLQNMTAIPMKQPPSLDKNGFGGGPPEIKSFTLAGRTGNTIWPSGSLKLSWKVDGATKITITPERVGNQTNELPFIPGGQHPAAGTYTVANIPGTSKWSGAYRLVASNKCGTHEATVEVVMARRVGLALSGGGSRGAFQVGVLDYLYNVKGIRPDGIASTSVGSVNALQLVMGDSPGKNAVEQLKDIWLELQQTSNMWVEEPWLINAKQTARDTISSFGWWDLAFFPLTLPIHAVDIKSKVDSLGTTMRQGVPSFFNLSPIENKMVSVFSEARVRDNGIAVRFIAVSLKTGEIVKVDEQGHVLASGGGKATLIDAAIASSIMPGIFPARRIGAHFCVDGGIREIIPVQYCIDDMGTNEVYAIACSAKTLEDPRQNWTMIDVMTRSMMDINFDEVVKDDIAPHGGWPEGVVVRSIFPRFNIFDPIMIEPGLIRIAMDYGWMCAADEIDTIDNGRGTARLAADKIVQLRLQNWADRYTIENVVSAPDPQYGFIPAISSGFMPPSRPARSDLRRSLNWYPPFLQTLRDRCRQVRVLAAQRLAAGGALPPTSTSWWQDWEAISLTAQRDTAFYNLDTPWQGIVGQIDTEAPPINLV
jgi:predicted acylesterase/phospholipase RssA